MSANALDAAGALKLGSFIISDKPLSLGAFSLATKSEPRTDSTHHSAHAIKCKLNTRFCSRLVFEASRKSGRISA